MDVILEHIGVLATGALAAAALPPAKPTLLEQIGHLFLNSVPTALLFLVLVVAYELLVHGPLTATLARRRGLTEGAIEDAQRAIAQAEARAQEYAEKLRHARAEVYILREQRLTQWNAERDAALETARKKAGETVNQAKGQIEAEAAAARHTIQGSAADLARLAVRAVLPAAAGGSR